LLLSLGELEASAFRLAHSNETVRRMLIEVTMRAPQDASALRQAAGDDGGSDLWAGIFRFVDGARESIRTALGAAQIDPKPEFLELLRSLEKPIASQQVAVKRINDQVESTRATMQAALRNGNA
jgi:hypothetical protein